MAAPRSKAKATDSTDEGTDAPVPAEDAPEASERAGRPTYDLKPVGIGDLPAKAPSKRALVYDDLLRQVMSNYGEDSLVEIAQFKSETGASMTATSLRKGERQIPTDIADWTFVAAKVDVDGVRESRLYAGYKLTEATLEGIKAAGYRVTGNAEDDDEDEDEV
jgi:hypothetical protein